jgi:hypothetical protein
VLPPSFLGTAGRHCPPLLRFISLFLCPLAVVAGVSACSRRCPAGWPRGRGHCYLRIAIRARRCPAGGSLSLITSNHSNFPNGRPPSGAGDAGRRKRRPAAPSPGTPVLL